MTECWSGRSFLSPGRRPRGRLNVWVTWAVCDLVQARSVTVEVLLPFGSSKQSRTAGSDQSLLPESRIAMGAESFSPAAPASAHKTVRSPAAQPTARVPAPADLDERHDPEDDRKPPPRIPSTNAAMANPLVRLGRPPTAPTGIPGGRAGNPGPLPGARAPIPAGAGRDARGRTGRGEPTRAARRVAGVASWRHTLMIFGDKTITFENAARGHVRGRDPVAYQVTEVNRSPARGDLGDTTE
jgi:hypothetical protein